MIDQAVIQSSVRDFIQHNFIFDQAAVFTDEDSLLGTGIIDSTGVLELIAHLEEQYQMSFEDNELIADNFDSITKITSFLRKKLGNG